MAVFFDDLVSIPFWAEHLVTYSPTPPILEHNNRSELAIAKIIPTPLTPNFQRGILRLATYNTYAAAAALGRSAKVFAECGNESIYTNHHKLKPHLCHACRTRQISSKFCGIRQSQQYGIITFLTASDGFLLDRQTQQQNHPKMRQPNQQEKFKHK